MAKYGNILILYGEDWDEDNLLTILEEEGASFQLLGNVCFIESLSKVNTSDIIRRIRAIANEFVFYHNHISDGSSIRSAGVDKETVDHINSLLFR